MDFPDIDITNEHNLPGVVIPDVADCLALMKRFAAIAGFELGKSTSSDGRFFRLHCLKGDKTVVKPNADGQYDPTGKCPCYYRFRCANSQGTQVRFGECCVVHNHPLVPQAFAHRIVPEDIIGEIRTLHRSGVEPARIRQILLSKGVSLSSTQICAIARPEVVEAFGTESAALKQHMEELGGIALRLTEQIAGKEKVIAIFTQLAQEKRDLIDFCDVVELDGTHAQLKLRWEVIPITLMDKDRKIQCGGIAFAAYFTTEVIAWLLKTIWSLDPEIQAQWRVLLTDEDGGFAPALVQFRDEVQVPGSFRHLLCAMHKKSNFMKKLNTCGQRMDEKRRLEKLFDVVCYSDHRAMADQALMDIEAKNIPRLQKYIDNHVRPILSQFSKSYLVDTFTCGMNTTSCAESCNRMLKRGMVNRLCSLTEARDHFTDRLDNHRRIVMEKLIHSRQIRCEVEESLGITLGAAMRAKVLEQMAGAAELQLEKSEDVWKAQGPNLPAVIYTVEKDDDETYHCTCGRVVNGGYPCRHIIAAARNDEVLLDGRYFNPRWVIDRREAQGRFEPGDDFRQADPDSDGDDDEFQEEIVQMDIPDALQRPMAEMIELFPRMSRENQYLTILHYAKHMAALGSRNPEKGIFILERLHEIREAVYEPVPALRPEGGGASTSESDVVPDQASDLEDADGRPKGRPPKQQIASSLARHARANTRTGEVSTCPICRQGHEIEDCPFFPEIQAVRLENESQPRPDGRRQCPVCHGYGHISRTCPVATEIRRSLEEGGNAE
jgi:hypothetical protein